MNILHIFASKTWGGGEQYVLTLAEQLRLQGHSVSLVSRKSKIIKQKVGNTIPLYLLPITNLCVLYSAIKLSIRTQKNKINIIHCHNFKDAFIAARAKALCRLRGHSVSVIVTRHLIKQGKANFIYNSLYKKIDKIIFVSNLAKNEFLKSNPKIAPEKIAAIHNSINCIHVQTNITPKNYRKQYNIANNKKNLLYMGRLSKEKGVDVLINALLNLKQNNWHLFIAGTGPEEKQLNQLVCNNKLENKVTFLGFVENTAELVSQSDIGIVPSICKESFGLVLLEYMQAGKPLITTNNGAAPEFIDDTIGILVPPSDEKSLAAGIVKLLSDTRLCAYLGENGKHAFAEKYNYNIFYNKITEVYKSLL